MNRSLTWANQLAEIGLTNQLFNNGIKRSWLLCGVRRISWSPSGPLARLALGTGYTRAQRTFTSGARIDRQTVAANKGHFLRPHHNTTPSPADRISKNAETRKYSDFISALSGRLAMCGWTTGFVIVYGRETNCYFKVLECFSVLEVGKVL